MPMPPSDARTLMPVQTTALCVMLFPTAGSKGKLFVYEKSLLGRFVTDAHAVQAKNAVSWRISVGLLMNFAGRPALCAGEEKYSVHRSTCFSYDAASPAVNNSVPVRES